MNTNTRTEISEVPLTGAQLAVGIVNAAILVATNVVAVSAVSLGMTFLGFSDAASNTTLAVYGLVLIANLDSIMKKLF
jgi:hypothetical protein